MEPTPAFALHSNHIVFPDGVREATLIIRDGLIQDVMEGPAGDLPYSLVDVGDKTLMPGLTDPHVHINEPGRTDWEGFDTATRSALAGGLTMLVDMPLNSSPVTTSVVAFDRKLAAAADRLYTDCGFWGGVVPGNEKDIRPLIEKGVLGFKAFLTHSGIDEFPNARVEDLRKAMPIIAAYGLPLLVHCEWEWGGVAEAAVAAGVSMGVTGSEVVAPADPRSYAAYLASRPSRWEDDAIALMIGLCEEYGCRTHIVHLSSADSVSQIRQAKKKGLPLTAETAQHYLYFSAEKIGDGQPLFKCAPPIRNENNRQRLWDALLDGTIDLVATDHSPAPPDLKELASGDLTKAWGGISSIQLALPVLWTAARERGGSLPQLVKWLSSGPALLTGQSSVRGVIAAGYEADLIMWEPEQRFRVTAEILYHKHRITPYLGEELYGVVEQTYLHGRKVFDNGSFTLPARGKIILR
ncbi:MAG TPA: allantoinase AllB [Puia sp.]|nr:allantoinase AllB [Puia sp.]